MTNKDVVKYILETPYNTNPAILLQHLEMQDEEIRHNNDLSKYVKTVNNIGPDANGNIQISIPEPVDLTGYATENFVNDKISEIKVEDTAMEVVSMHNIAKDAHNDIRLILKGIDNRLTAFFNSDDTTLDQLSEIVEYITNNKTLIESITTNKVSIEDIIDNLVTNSSKHPLSAAQGVVLKELIDSLSKKVDDKIETSQLERAVNEALILAKESGDFDGPQGPVGLTGPQGEKGEKGEKGDQGEVGPIGPVGPQGEKGEKGDPGADGLMGPEGPQGPQGPQGEQGLTGLTGPQGPIGPQGEQGPQGIQGERGLQGERGERGEKGETGERGEKGETGAVGPQGEVGPQGPQGEKGEKGDKGDKGADGTGVTILGTYESYEQLIAQNPTGKAGESYLVKGHLYVWSVTENIWEDVGNIQGPQGEKGEVGPAGPQGEKGETGLQGEVGPQGPVGPAGPIGPQGERGEKGETGLQGPIGLTGQQGPIGPQGEKGETGPQGEVGPIGPQGEKGEPGNDGKTPVKGVDYFTEEEKNEIKPNFSFEINMIDADSLPSVSVSGVYPNLVYTFNIPYGQVNTEPEPDPELEPKMWIGYLPYDPDGVIGVDSIDVIGAGLTKKYIDGAVNGGTLKQVPIATMSKTSIGIVPESAYACCIYPADKNYTVTIDNGIGGKETFSEKHGDYPVNNILLNNLVDGVQYKVSGFLSSMEGERFFYVD